MKGFEMFDREKAEEIAPALREILSRAGVRCALTWAAEGAEDREEVLSLAGSGFFREDVRKISHSPLAKPVFLWYNVSLPRNTGV